MVGTNNSLKNRIVNTGDDAMTPALQTPPIVSAFQDTLESVESVEDDRASSLQRDEGVASLERRCSQHGQ